MTAALEESADNQERNRERLSALRDALEAEILGMNAGALVNGRSAHRLPHISSVTFPGVNAESLLLALDREGICVSTGSACSTGNPDPSPTLLAIGLTPELAKSTIRFSFGEGNDLEQVNNVSRTLKAILSSTFRLPML